MKCAASLSDHNRFAILSVDNIIEIDELVETQNTQPSKDAPTGKPPRIFCRRWEMKLPAKLVIGSLGDEETAQSLNLKVSLETTDTGKTKSVDALLDSGATGMFISQDYVKTHQLTTQSLANPIPVFNVDSTPNKASSITEAV